MNYQHNFKMAVTAMIPWFKRQEEDVAWVYSLLTPDEVIQEAFLALIERTHYFAAIHCQVIHLEHVYNDLFDPKFRRMRILDGEAVEEVYIYGHGQLGTDRYIYGHGVPNPEQEYIYGHGPTAVVSDGIVECPLSLYPALAQIRFTINRYNPAGRRWRFQFI